MTALVDAMVRGRGGTAALERSIGTPNTARPIDWAISLAEDGLFSAVVHAWRDAQAAHAGDDAELGKGGFALGATLLDAAAEATGSAQRRGFARSIAVLEDAIRYLEGAGDLDMVRYACSLAATACDELKDLHPSDSHEHQQLERRAMGLRARSQQDDDHEE